MADWKIIILSGIVSAVIAIILSLIFFPLFFLGPLIGGFFAAYFSQGYEDYGRLDRKDGAVIGVLSGIIGGVIISSFFILGFGTLNTIMGLINTKMGVIANNMIAGYIILQFSIIISIILGAIGGFIGVMAKK